MHCGDFKCQLNVETACLVAAIFNIITATDGVLVSISCFVSGMPILTTLYVPWVYQIKDQSTVTRTMFIFEKIGPPVLMGVTLIAIIFSALLIVGILKRNRSYVKSFFIGGIIVVSLSFALHLFGLQIICSFNSAYTLEGFQGTVFNYIGILTLHLFLMVELFWAQRTMKKFRATEAKQQFNHCRFENEDVDSTAECSAPKNIEE